MSIESVLNVIHEDNSLVETSIERDMDSGIPTDNDTASSNSAASSSKGSNRGLNLRPEAENRLKLLFAKSKKKLIEEDEEDSRGRDEGRTSRLTDPGQDMEEDLEEDEEEFNETEDSEGPSRPSTSTSVGYSSHLPRPSSSSLWTSRIDKYPSSLSRVSGMPSSGPSFRPSLFSSSSSFVGKVCFGGAASRRASRLAFSNPYGRAVGVREGSNISSLASKAAPALRLQISKGTRREPSNESNSHLSAAAKRILSAINSVDKKRISTPLEEAKKIPVNDTLGLSNRSVFASFTRPASRFTSSPGIRSDPYQSSNQSRIPISSSSRGNLVGGTTLFNKHIPSSTVTSTSINSSLVSTSVVEDNRLNLRQDLLDHNINQEQNKEVKLQEKPLSAVTSLLRRPQEKESHVRSASELTGRNLYMETSPLNHLTTSSSGLKMKQNKLSGRQSLRVEDQSKPLVVDEEVLTSVPSLPQLKSLPTFNFVPRDTTQNDSGKETSVVKKSKESHEFVFSIPGNVKSASKDTVNDCFNKKTTLGLNNTFSFSDPAAAQINVEKKLPLNQVPKTSLNIKKMAPDMDSQDEKYQLFSSPGNGSNCVANTWSCPGCMIVNDKDKINCPCCQTTQPGVQVTDKTTSAPINRWGDAFAKPVGSWECQECLVINKDHADKCISCETPRTKTVKSSPVPSSQASGWTQVSSTSSLVFGPNVASFKTSKDEEGAPSSQWRCETCLVYNDSIRINCSGCKRSRVTSKDVVASFSGYKFGIHNNNDNSKESDAKTKTESTGFASLFGQNNKNVSLNESKDQSTSSFKFMTSPVSFGGNSTTEVPETASKELTLVPGSEPSSVSAASTTTTLLFSSLTPSRVATTTTTTTSSIPFQSQSFSFGNPVVTGTTSGSSVTVSTPSVTCISSTETPVLQTSWTTTPSINSIFGAGTSSSIENKKETDKNDLNASSSFPVFGDSTKKTDSKEGNNDSSSTPMFNFTGKPSASFPAPSTAFTFGQKTDMTKSIFGGTSVVKTTEDSVPSVAPFNSSSGFTFGVPSTSSPFLFGQSSTTTKTVPEKTAAPTGQSTGLSPFITSPPSNLTPKQPPESFNFGGLSNSSTPFQFGAAPTTSIVTAPSATALPVIPSFGGSLQANASPFGFASNAPASSPFTFTAQPTTSSETTGTRKAIKAKRRLPR